MALDGFDDLLDFLDDLDTNPAAKPSPQLAAKAAPVAAYVSVITFFSSAYYSFFFPADF